STGLSKLGSTSTEQTNSIVKLIHLIDEIPMNEKQGYDVLGFVYEYLISMFAANAGKKAGEFYTPHEVSLLMSEIVADHLQEREHVEIYDPTSGSGSLLLNIGHSLSKYVKNKDKIKYYAQELKQNTYDLTRMNLVMRGIKPDNIVTRRGDTLEQDWPDIDENNNYSPLYVDAVVSNPPYSQKWNPENKESDPRYKNYGLAPKGKSDYAFLLHDLFHVKPDGIMTIVLPHGVLFRGGAEAVIRENLIQKNNIEAIIGLPPNIFFGTGIPTIIMILKQAQSRESTDVLFIDASKGFIKEGPKNKLRASDIKRIVDTVRDKSTVEKYSRLVKRKEIVENEFNLNIPRYIDSSMPKEDWDIYAIMHGGIPNYEIEKLSKYWDVFPLLKEKLFNPINDFYSELIFDDFSNIVEDDEDIKQFKNAFDKQFKDFNDYLVKRIIENLDIIVPEQEKEMISSELMRRMNFIKLIDQYDGYQLFSDAWEVISIDLEVYQTEGKGSLNGVKPNFIERKKGGKTVKVQSGFIGTIIPFEIAQARFFKDELNSITLKEDRMNEIKFLIEEQFDALEDEDREESYVNEEKTSFINAEVIKYVRSLGKNTEEDGNTETILRAVNEFILEERKLRRDVKKTKDLLHEQTKDFIENLDEVKTIGLLKDKWITPFIDSLYGLLDSSLSELTHKINLLADKYKETFADITNDINETSKELNLMLSELVGDEHTIKGIEMLKKMLNGENNE
ncbi:MAG TPA: type I restriction-modification system subunit M, partial [Atopostipes sp.]|nr:type I restriction-modification system subunit M [Atopostipes sp.]